jgi:hypothetical protein
MSGPARLIAVAVAEKVWRCAESPPLVHPLGHGPFTVRIDWQSLP